MTNQPDDLEQKIDLVLENIELKKREQEYTAEATKLREEKKQLENKIESLSPSPKKRKQFPIKYALLLLMGLTAISSAYYGCRKINQSRAGEHYAQALRIIKNDPIDENAIPHLTRAIELNPNNPEYYTQRGSLYVNTDPAKALEDLNKALKLGMSDSKIYRDLAVARYRSNPEKDEKALEEATDHITKAMKSNFSDPLLHYIIGDILLELAEIYRNKLSEKPAPPDVYEISISEEYMRKHYYDPAILEFSRAIYFDKDNYDAYLNRGKALVLAGLHDKAIPDFTTAIDICPRGDCIEAYLARANALNDRDRIDEALHDCNEVIKYHPDFEEAYTLRAHLWDKIGDNARKKQDEEMARNIRLGLEWK